MGGCSHSIINRGQNPPPPPPPPNCYTPSLPASFFLICWHPPFRQYIVLLYNISNLARFLLFLIYTQFCNKLYHPLISTAYPSFFSLPYVIFLSIKLSLRRHLQPSIIYSSKILCLSSWLSSCHPVILSSCHSCGTLSYSLCSSNQTDQGDEREGFEWER